MKIIFSILSRLERESFYCSILALISLIPRCRAQDIDSTTTIAISVPVLMFVTILVFISICFCAYQCQTYQSRRNYLTRRYRQSIRNQNHQRINNPQGRFIISARPHPALTSLSSDTSLSDTPSPIAGTHPATSPTVSQAFELPVVSLPIPEATLHQASYHNASAPPTGVRRASLSYIWKWK